jgi:hypothetical protein
LLATLVSVSLEPQSQQLTDALARDERVGTRLRRAAPRLARGAVILSGSKIKVMRGGGNAWLRPNHPTVSRRRDVLETQALPATLLASNTRPRTRRQRELPRLYVPERRDEPLPSFPVRFCSRCA